MLRAPAAAIDGDDERFKAIECLDQVQAGLVGDCDRRGERVGEAKAGPGHARWGGPGGRLGPRSRSPSGPRMIWTVALACQACPLDLLSLDLPVSWPRRAPGTGVLLEFIYAGYPRITHPAPVSTVRSD